MKVFAQNKHYTLYNGNMLDMPGAIEQNSIDAIVTDPPYELNFMNKGWDNSGIAFQAGTWRKCYEVLKPGGYLLAFGGSRTFHRIACAIEDAGFEIRDTIMWLYGSGFPKSMSLGKSVESKLVNGSANKQDFKTLPGDKVEAGSWGISANAEEYGFRPANYDLDGHLRVVNVDYQTAEGKRWDGWGTALKPAYEPIIVARKPCEGSTTDNVLKYGVGGINIDECRIEHDEEVKTTNRQPKSGAVFNTESSGYDNTENHMASADPMGRFPANVVLTYDENDEKEVCGGMPDTKNGGGAISHKDFSKHNGSMMHFSSQKEEAGRYENGYIAPCDSGSAARYFYCAKASKRDRDEGLETFEDKILAFSNQAQAEAKRGNELKIGGMNDIKRRKPTDLMQYLIRLVTPKGGTILDPFNGSGSTGKAAMYENKDRNAEYKYIGIELSEEYLQISKARIDFAAGDQVTEIVSFTDITKQAGPVQMDIFDFMK